MQARLSLHLSKCHIVGNHMSRLNYLKARNILTDAQYGFRKILFCETLLIITIQDLAKTVHNKGQTDVNLLDFSNAFDKVPHHRLLHKLEFYGIRGSLNSWTSSFRFLRNRLQQVLLDGVTTSSTPVQSGVPLQFLVLINDLPKSIPP